MTPRVAVFSELPTPYRWPVFERLLRRDDLDLRVFFLARGESDRDWSFPFRPDPRRVRFLPGHTFTARGRRTVHVHVNPTIFGTLRRGRFDAAVFPGYAMFASQAGALWCRARGVPYVVFSETIARGGRADVLAVLKRAILPVLVGGASAWLATGKLSREYLVGHGARPDRVFRFPNAPDVVAFRAAREAAAPERAALRASLGAGDEPVVLFAGRLLRVKRCDVLLDAVAEVRARGVPARLWVVGDGPERAALAARARAQGMADARFLGNLATAELPAIYGAADLFVLPSDHEPWGAVVVEAAACGLPVVVSDRVGAGPDAVAPGRNGDVFVHGRSGALAAVLARLLSDREGLRRMGRESGTMAEAFRHERCEEEFAGAVRAALGAGGRR